MSPLPTAPFAAVFIDYENVFLHFRERYCNPPRLHHLCSELAQALPERLRQLPYEVTVTRAWAVADFERLPPGGPSGLIRSGVEPVYVRGGADHKNAADIRLCVEAVATCHTCPTIGTFVLVTGDRDYVPLVQHLRQQGRRVLLVSFPENTASEFYRYFNHDDHTLLNAYSLLPDQLRAGLHSHRARYLLSHPETEVVSASNGTSTTNGAHNLLPAKPTPSSAPIELPPPPMPIYTPAPANWVPPSRLPKWPAHVKPPSLRERAERDKTTESDLPVPKTEK